MMFLFSNCTRTQKILRTLEKRLNPSTGMHYLHVSQLMGHGEGGGQSGVLDNGAGTGTANGAQFGQAQHVANLARHAATYGFTGVQKVDD